MKKQKGFCIWITGLSGSGKTTLADELRLQLGRPVSILDGDEVRKTLCKDLGFSKDDRDENVSRIAFVASELVKQGIIVIVSCISPYKDARLDARNLIGDFIEVFLDTPKEVLSTRSKYLGEYEIGTPELVINSGTPQDNALTLINYLVDAEYLGTSFMLGRFQLWHAGHTALFKEALKEGRVCIGVRNLKKSKSNPFDFREVEVSIQNALVAYEGRYNIIQMPNITSIVYGRDVGYDVKRIDLTPDLESISGTKIRNKI